MSALASGHWAINLGQGFPDTDGPRSLLDAAVDAIRSGANQYPPGRGVPALRTAVAEHQRRWYGLQLDPDTEVLVTAGATEAITASVVALCEPGDEVVMLEPYYDSYAAADRAGRRASGGPCRCGCPDYTLDADRAGRGVQPTRTRLVLLNTPHNPTGRVLDAAGAGSRGAAGDRARRASWSPTRSTSTWPSTAHRHTPLATLPGMAERTVTISSAGKTFSVTGWKIGWLHGPAELVDAIATVKQFLTFVNGAPFQPAVARALAAAGGVLRRRRPAALQAGRDLLVAGLRRRRVRRPGAARARTSWWPTPHRSATTTAWRCAWTCRDWPAWSRYRCSVFHDDRAGRSQPGPVRVLQAAGRAGRGGGRLRGCPGCPAGQLAAPP